MGRDRVQPGWMALFVAVLLAGCGGDSPGVTGAPSPSSPSTTAPEFQSLGEAFYDPPNPLPEAPPGTLIRQEEFEGPTGTRAWRVLYHSRAIDGRDVAVSGVVLAPRGKEVPPGGRPIVTVGPATTGLADACGASKLEAGPPLEVMSPLWESGYIVAITDYEGIGTPGVHPYGVGESAGRNVLDVARAARALPESQASPQVVVYGESTGGHAAYFSAAIAAGYAPELQVLGTVAQAPLLSLVNVMRLGPSSPQSGLLMLFLVGLNAAHPDQAPLEAVLTEEGIAEADVVTRRCAGDVGRHFSGKMKNVLLKNPTEVPSWMALLQANSLHADRVDGPLLLTKGSDDEVFPRAFTDAFAQELCASEVPLEYRVYPGATHASVTRASADDVVRWVRDRVEGRPVASTC